MPKKYRLSRADFLRLPRSKARRVHGTYFSLTIYPLLGAQGPKMACVVSKKVAARATDRNKVERRCRGVMRPQMVDIKKPCALVFLAKREVVDASYAQISRDIGALITRIQDA